MGWMAGVLPSRNKIFLFSTAFRPALDSQPLIQWALEISLGVKWPGREADHLPHLVPCVIKHGYNFNFFY
jgi:hypothetical protein